MARTILSNSLQIQLKMGFAQALTVHFQHRYPAPSPAVKPIRMSPRQTAKAQKHQAAIKDTEMMS